MRRQNALPFQPPDVAPTVASYEVRCERCQCSFAPGTKRCVHCGARLGRAVPTPLGTLEGAHPPAGADEDEGRDVPTAARGLLWLISAAAAILLSALQTCGLGQ